MSLRIMTGFWWANYKTASFLVGQLLNSMFFVDQLEKAGFFGVDWKTAGCLVGKLGNSMFCWTKTRQVFDWPIRKQQVLLGPLGNSMLVWFWKPLNLSFYNPPVLKTSGFKILKKSISTILHAQNQHKSCLRYTTFKEPHLLIQTKTGMCAMRS